METQTNTDTKTRKTRKPDKRTIRKTVEHILALAPNSRLSRTMLITRVAQHLQYPTEEVDMVVEAIGEYLDANTGRGKQLSYRDGCNGGYALKHTPANAR